MTPAGRRTGPTTSEETTVRTAEVSPLREIRHLPVLPYYKALDELATHEGDCLQCQQPGPGCPEGRTLAAELRHDAAAQHEAARWN
jgi:hypothetical protein